MNAKNTATPRTLKLHIAAYERLWMLQARCAGINSFMDLPTELQQEWCASCPVRTDCLDYALTLEAGMARSDRHGVWGGATPTGRWRLDRGEAH